MRAVSGADYVVVEWGTEDSLKGETLCVIDDQWQAMSSAWNELGRNLFDDSALIAYTEQQFSRFGESALDARALLVLPMICKRLTGWQRLVVMPFPVSAEQTRVLVETCKTFDLHTRGHFLVDQFHGSGRDSIYLGAQTLALLHNVIGVEQWRCAIYSRVAGVGTVFKVSKAEVVDGNGTALADWWNRVHWRISYDYYSRTTRVKWHNPSEIPYKWMHPDDGFIEFVERQAALDIYGVWERLREVLSGASSERAKAFEYLCGKAFLHTAGEKADSFPGTALRPLLVVLARRYGAGWFEHPVDPIALYPFGTIPDMDRPELPFGIFQVGAPAPFDAFAWRLVEWLRLIHAENVGAVLAEVSVAWLDGDAARIDFVFSGPLSEKAFLEHGSGLIKQAWRELVSVCSPSAPMQSDCERVSLALPRVS